MEAKTAPLPEVVSREEWLAARKSLLQKEKETTRAQDALNAARRHLPMVEIDKDYQFEGPNGKVRLIDLFEGRRQLVIYHFMFDPNDPPPGRHEPYDEGCSGCSHMADNIGHLAHLHARETSFAMVSRAPLSKIEPFKKRMGWTMPWFSSFGSDFNYDFHVTIDDSKGATEYNYMSKEELAAKGPEFQFSGEMPGISVFLRDGDRIFHTYSTYARGLEGVMGTFHLLELTPYGRQEDWEDSPAGWPKGEKYWIRHHDKYDSQDAKPCCGSNEKQGT